MSLVCSFVCHMFLCCHDTHSCRIWGNSTSERPLPDWETPMRKNRWCILCEVHAKILVYAAVKCHVNVTLACVLSVNICAWGKKNSWTLSMVVSVLDMLHYEKHRSDQT
jgi:hypothetical protein